MDTPKLSLCIPYYQRLPNLALALEGIIRQTIDTDAVEVVVGAMDLDPDLHALVRSVSDRLDLVTVVSPRKFSIPAARNLAMRQARGQVVVQMDADSLLAPDALAALYEGCFAFGQSQCVVGQVVGYDNNTGDDVVDVVHRSVDEHLAALAELRAGSEPADPRFHVPHHVPWAFAWTGLLAVPRRLVVGHDLLFDETFIGWGVDDLEWGYRLALTGTPIVLRPEVAALHLPHERDRGANDRSERLNYRRFLRKWPAPDVELASAIGDVRANDEMPSLRAALDAVLGAGGTDHLGSVRGRANGREVVHLGVRLDQRGALRDPASVSNLDSSAPLEILSLIGLSLPFADGEIDECILHPDLDALSTPFRDLIDIEVARLTSAPVDAL